MFLLGTQLKFKLAKDAKLIIGKNVEYLLKQDIDKSGRGYFFPRWGKVCGYERRHLIIEDSYINVSEIKEIVEAI